jgi:cytochrome oxidase assembly protein ShyY1
VCTAFLFALETHGRTFRLGAPSAAARATWTSELTRRIAARTGKPPQARPTIQTRQHTLTDTDANTHAVGLRGHDTNACILGFCLQTDAAEAEQHGDEVRAPCALPNRSPHFTHI